MGSEAVLAISYEQRQFIDLARVYMTMNSVYHYAMFILSGSIFQFAINYLYGK